MKMQANPRSDEESDRGAVYVGEIKLTSSLSSVKILSIRNLQYFYT